MACCSSDSASCPTRRSMPARSVPTSTCGGGWCCWLSGWACWFHRSGQSGPRHARTKPRARLPGPRLVGRCDGHERPLATQLLVYLHPGEDGVLGPRPAGAVGRREPHALLHHDVGHTAVGRDPDAGWRDVVPLLKGHPVEVALKPRAVLLPASERDHSTRNVEQAV